MYIAAFHSEIILQGAGERGGRRERGVQSHLIMIDVIHEFTKLSYIIKSAGVYEVCTLSMMWTYITHINVYSSLPINQR